MSTTPYLLRLAWRGAPVLALAGLFALLDRGFVVPYGLLMRAIFDTITGEAAAGLNVWTLIAILTVANWFALIVVRPVGRVATQFLQGLLEGRLQRNLIETLLESRSTATGISAGGMLNRFRDDVEALTAPVLKVATIFGVTVSGAASIYIMATIDPLITVVALLPGGAGLRLHQGARRPDRRRPAADPGDDGPGLILPRRVPGRRPGHPGGERRRARGGTLPEPERRAAHSRPEGGHPRWPHALRERQHGRGHDGHTSRPGGAAHARRLVHRRRLRAVRHHDRRELHGFPDAGSGRVPGGAAAVPGLPGAAGRDGPGVAAADRGARRLAARAGPDPGGALPGQDRRAPARIGRAGQPDVQASGVRSWHRGRQSAGAPRVVRRGHGKDRLGQDDAPGGAARSAAAGRRRDQAQRQARRQPVGRVRAAPCAPTRRRRRGSSATPCAPTS